MFAVAELANTMKINFSLFDKDSEEPRPLHFASPLTIPLHYSLLLFLPMNRMQGDHFERATIGNIVNFNGKVQKADFNFY